MAPRCCLVLFAALLAWGWLPRGATAHEARPAYLQITEIDEQRYEVLWRVPVLSGSPLPVLLQLPTEVVELREPIRQQFPDSLLERRIVAVADGLPGKRIRFPGLQATITDILVRIDLLDSPPAAFLVQPSEPWIEVQPPEESLEIAGAFLVHGMEHILEGFDHLLFVLALLLIVRDLRTLLWTITAFTIAHSITLALATLGVVSVPSGPVEAAIALSILLLATEILRARQGLPSLTVQKPWLVAFCFGLLHGFGFAGALTSIGLPAGDIPLALLFFNLGVELGQILFVVLVVASGAAVRMLALPARSTNTALLVVTYTIGGLASFWFVERAVGLAG